MSENSHNSAQALFAQVREALDAEYDGFCAWCQCSVHEQPHASECEGRRALAALSAIERHVQAQRYREKVLRREVNKQLGRHLCYTSEFAREKFWQAVDVTLPASGEKGQTDG